jgi:hypothetical protein
VVLKLPCAYTVPGYGFQFVTTCEKFSVPYRCFLRLVTVTEHKNEANLLIWRGFNVGGDGKTATVKVSLAAVTNGAIRGG